MGGGLESRVPSGLLEVAGLGWASVAVVGPGDLVVRVPGFDLLSGDGVLGATVTLKGEGSAHSPVLALGAQSAGTPGDSSGGGCHPLRPPQGALLWKRGHQGEQILREVPLAGGPDPSRCPRVSAGSLVKGGTGASQFHPSTDGLKAVEDDSQSGLLDQEQHAARQSRGAGGGSLPPCVFLVSCHVRNGEPTGPGWRVLPLRRAGKL